MAKVFPPVADPLPPRGVTAAAGHSVRALRRTAAAIRGSKAATAGAAILAVHVVLAAFGPALAPYPYTQFHMTQLLQPPSAQFLAGTDQFGRDQLSRVMWGARGTLVLAAVSTVLGEALGVTVGLVGGYYRGLVDEILMRTMDALMAFPSILLAMLILTSLGHSPLYVVIGISVVFMPRAARVLRGVVLSLAASEFVDAARVRGERGWYILFRELLPNAWTPIIVDSTIRFSYAILLATSLGFLGLGAAPPSPDWGLMINEALPFLNQAPWLALLPALAISSAVVGANLLGDGIQASLRPE